MGNKNSISFIFPVYNEENRLKFLLKISLIMKKNNFNEYIFVNDGSTDNSLNLLKKFTNRNKKISSYKLF